MKKRSKIRRTSVKRQAQLDEYYETVRPAYMKAHPKCEVENCGKPSTDVHHKKGRSGKMLLDTEFFLPTCREDHVYIEGHPDWAKAKGYSLSRLEI